MGAKGNLVGNGAYTLADHVINEKIVFERNKNYWNDKETVINKATFLAIANAATDVSRYRAGDLDMTNYALPPEQFATLKKRFQTKCLRQEPFLLITMKLTINEHRLIM